MNVTFSNPQFLWAMPLALGPLVIHLFFRRDPPAVTFSDLRFVRRALSTVSERLALRRYLLLLIRTLVIAAIVFFCAGPALQRGPVRASLAAGSGDRSPAVVLLIDISYSTGYRDGGKTRLDRYRDRARAVIERLPAGSRIGIVTYSDRVEAATPVLSTDRDYLSSMLDQVRGSFRTTDIAPAVTAAARLLASDPGSNRTIVLLSDGARHGFRGKDHFPGSWRLVTFVPEESDNGWLERLKAEYDGRAERWRLNVEGRAARQAGKRTLISLWRGGEASKTGSDFAVPSRDGRFVHALALAGGPEGNGCRVVLAPDGLEADNTLYASLERPASVPVRIVDGDPRFGSAAAESFYLRSVFPKARVITESELDAAVLPVPGVIIAANLRGGHPVLERYLRSGGGLFMFAGENCPEDLDAGYMPARLGIRRRGQENVRWSFARHPLAESLRAGEFEWEKTVVTESFILEPKPGAGILARTGSGQPFIVEGRCGAGRVMLCASTADRDWDNFAARPAFAPFMQAAVRYLAGSGTSSGRAPLKVGERIVLRPGETGEIIAPSGSRARTEPYGDRQSFAATDEPGLYRLVSGARTLAVFAVNLEAASGESDLAPMTAGELKDRFQGHAVTILDDRASWEKDLLAAVGGTDISRHMLLAALLLLCAETMLSVKPSMRAKARADDRRAA